MTRPTLSTVRAGHPLGVVAIVALLLAGAIPGPDVLPVAAVALAMLLALVVGPASAVTAVAAMLPLVFLSAEIGSTRWSLLELALLGCGVACAGELALRLAVRREAQRVSHLLRPFDVTVVAGALVVLGILSLGWVADVRASANSQRELRRVILEPLVVILAVRLSPLEDVRRLVGRSLAASALVVSAIALAQVGLRSSGVEVGAVFRPIGTYPHPNNLALFLERVVWLPLAVAGRHVPDRAAVAATGLVAVACAATLSRGAVVALIVGGVAFLVLSRRRVPRLVVAAGVVVAAALLVVARLGGDGTESLGSRGKIWAAAGDMLRDYPVTGVGIDQFYQVYGTRYVDPGGWSERYTSHPHNLVLDFWLQLGVFGLVVLAGIVWITGRLAWTIRTGERHIVGVALAAGLLGGLAHGLVDNFFFLPDLATFLWLTLALASPPVARPSLR